MIENTQKFGFIDVIKIWIKLAMNLRYLGIFHEVIMASIQFSVKPW